MDQHLPGAGHLWEFSVCRVFKPRSPVFSQQVPCSHATVFVAGGSPSLHSDASRAYEPGAHFEHCIWLFRIKKMLDRRRGVTPVGRS